MVKLSLKMLKLLLKTLVLYFCEDWDAVSNMMKLFLRMLMCILKMMHPSVFL